MEASENTMALRGEHEPVLHRVDAQRIAELLTPGTNSSGFARLALMVDTVLPRLTGERPGR